MDHTSYLQPRKEPYVPKLTKSIILVCGTCKIRYIKTRPKQDACIKCVVRANDLKKLRTR